MCCCPGACRLDGAGNFCAQKSEVGCPISRRRYKTDIKRINKASESILALKPVSFRYKIHKDTTPQFGLIAEEVAQVNPDLVVRDKDGEIYTVRYDAVTRCCSTSFSKNTAKCRSSRRQLLNSSLRWPSKGRISEELPRISKSKLKLLLRVFRE